MNCNKLYKRLVSAVIPFTLALSAAEMYCPSAAAAEVSNDNIDASLSLSTVGRGNILGDLKIKNNNDFDIDNIDISFTFPEGYDQDSAKVFPDKTELIKSGEEFSFQAEFEKIIEDTGQTWGPSYGSAGNRSLRSSMAGSRVSSEYDEGGSYLLSEQRKRNADAAAAAAAQNSKNSSDKSDKSKNSSGTPSTGDNFPLKTLAAVMAAAGGGIALCIKTKNGRKVMALVVCTAVCGTAAAPRINAYADEEETTAQTETTTNEPQYEVHTFEIEEKINVDNADRIVKVTLTYNYPTGEQTTTGEVFDVYESILDDKTGTYYLFSKLPAIGGSLSKFRSLSGVSYTITDKNENELMSGELEAEESWSIKDPGFVVGENTLTLSMEFEDGSTEEETIKINNLCPENMESIDADKEDSDEDGILNFIEDIYHTDKDNADTDGDGLSDGDEINILGTDPLKKDSDDNEKDDNEEDADNDGISNYDEIYVHFTSPVSADTDGDGISDSDEINKYKTSPVSVDTDGDKASDAWEIKNKLDPLKADEDFGDLIPDESIVKCDDEDVKIFPVIDEMCLNENLTGYMGIEPFRVQLDDEKKAKITIPLEELNVPKEKVPALYFYDAAAKKLVETELTLNREDSDEEYRKPVSSETEISRSGIYILLDKHCFCEDAVQPIEKEEKEAEEKNDKESTDKKNETVEIFLVTDSKEENSDKDENSESSEKSETSPSGLTVKTYTGRLNNKRPAAIVKFTAIKDKPSAAKETHE